MTAREANSGELELVISEKSVPAHGVVGLTLESPDRGILPEWSAGAHIDVLLPGGVVRQYSLCGEPGDRTRWQIAVLRVPDGRGGSAVVHDELAVGDRLQVRGPRNNFQLIAADEYVFVAGGIGITPFLPMLADVASRGAAWKIMYGGRTRASMAFREELRARYGEHVQLHPQDECGMLDLDSIFEKIPSGAAVYCCGPEALIAATEERAADRRDVVLRTERFSALAAEGEHGEFEVECTQSGVTLTVPPGRSILDVAEEAGIAAFSSCREGTCGSCETPVLSGTVEHHDVILTDDERAANDRMMICVSRATGDRLVIDL
ncbi:oxidoreductase [Pseudonocardia sp. C8]|uniref:PDR/VanB family oxidoreductase n=1 Tax=Pseudonocardia sp. C8 TaxID=2762759 RepID=UPI00164301E0|nr:PDR/VanB family oxidoreductase [Pseudonocardia sp. C8]MBC3194898.1 oxidoreductase [Pseudonocardia sp. C8]